MKNKSNAIIVLSGGINSDGSFPEYVQNRLTKALEIKSDNDYLITASRTTVYKAPPRDSDGFPIDDAVQYAQFFLDNGVPREDLRIENCSFETLGSAYFLRNLHIDPLEIANLTIITSSFHMPRTKAMFDFVFSLPDNTNLRKSYNITYIDTPNAGLNDDFLQERCKREKQGIQRVQELKQQINNLQEFNKWLFAHHAAYTIGLPIYRISDKVKKTY